MSDTPLLKGTAIKTVFAALEVIILAGILMFAFSGDDEGVWGYWGSIVAIISMLSPIFLYAIPNAIFTIRNLIMVTGDRHTPDSIKQYHKLSKRYFIWGIVTGGLYGGLLVPIFLLENIFLFSAYRKELEPPQNA